MSISFQNRQSSYIALLAGNPNVGKSTVFNALTGMRQHTGNWSGKTVTTARGVFYYQGNEFILTDLPGTYSPDANSPDEAAAANAILHEHYDVIIIVADATSIERNLGLIIKILDITPKAVVCLNLMDEARKKQIKIDVQKLSLQLGVPVIPTAARSKEGLDTLKQTAYLVAGGQTTTCHTITKHCQQIEQAIAVIQPFLPRQSSLQKRNLALCLLDPHRRNDVIQKENLTMSDDFRAALKKADCIIGNIRIADALAEDNIKRSEHIYRLCVSTQKPYRERDRKIDKILTSKSTGIPIMLLLLALIFYITIVLANAPSEWLASGFEWLREYLYALADYFHWSDFWKGIVIDGMYSTSANVVSVMLPPMAIFFPLFTLLEDLGYLPRAAFNLDKCFCCAGTHGKHALTAIMGFGCNACGVTGCRIMENYRDRKIAAVTNNFVPCNGRFPALIAVISTLIVGGVPDHLHSVLSAAILAGAVFFSILVSLGVSKLLSLTLMKNKTSEFIFELPPYRQPQILKTILRSLCDRTIFVLGRAVIVAVPAGIIIWLLANVNINDKTIIWSITEFLDPFARWMGLDGVILTSFILGFPANEIVLPIAVMIYASNGTLTDCDNLMQLQHILTDNGWTTVTAICTVLFSLMHFPCSTTCITIYKETGSFFWTSLAVVIPTICGMVCCILVNVLSTLVL